MKTCFKCKEEKPISEFYAHKQMADGYLNKCKPCSRSDSRNNRKANIDKYREYDRKRGSRQTAEYLREYRAKNPEKYKARSAVQNAIRDGRLEKPEKCSCCGEETRIHGHHDDYSRPLEVIWLCTLCHKQRHKELGWGYVGNPQPTPSPSP